MNKIVRLLLKKLPNLKAGKKWQASHKINEDETAKRPIVKAFDCGLKGAVPWFKFEFTEDGKDHTIKGTLDFKNKDEVVTIDDLDVENDDVIVSNRIQRSGIGGRLRGVVEFEFTLKDDVHRYRFDATVGRVSIV